jgi:hypothetical protein
MHLEDDPLCRSVISFSDSYHHWQKISRLFSLTQHGFANCSVSGYQSLSRSDKAQNTSQKDKESPDDENRSRKLPHLKWRDCARCKYQVAFGRKAARRDTHLLY